MPNFSNFLYSDGYADNLLSKVEYADGIAYMISQRGVSLAMVRGGVVQAAQTVLIEPIGQSAVGNESRNETGEHTEYDVIVIGVKDHDSLDDFDVEREDIFKYNDIWYEVLTVEDYQPGKIEAKAKARE